MIRGSGRSSAVAVRSLSSQSAPRASHAPTTSSLDTLPPPLRSISQQSDPAAQKAIGNKTPPAMTSRPALAVLPLSMILRSLMVTTISSSTVLLPPSMFIMTQLAHAKSPLLNPDRNRLMRWLLKKTFYKQFCAGENAAEVRATIAGLKSVGFKGVMLGYAKEVVLSKEDAAALAATGAASKDHDLHEVEPWKNGTLETVEMATPGDFVALKFTGAGRQALYALSANLDPPPGLKHAIDSICDLAARRDVRLLFDAEQQAVQAGIDAWTLAYMRQYNAKTPGKAVVYGTYQAYLKSTPATLARHLAIARKEGFTLGVKLVRGAYIGSDPRHLIHDTKADTDACYDGIAQSLIRQQYGEVLRPAPGEEDAPFPLVSLALATHNLETVRAAHAVRAAQAEHEKIDLVYAQLQGMADEVSCELVQCSQENAERAAGSGPLDRPQAYKYLVWGSTGECMKYLLRRAQENKDAVQRTRDGRNAMAAELVRRMVKPFGWS